jgi:predicted transcriptional regulator
MGYTRIRRGKTGCNENKYRLNNKTKEPIYVDWKVDNVKEIQENDNRRKHQSQRYEE